MTTRYVRYMEDDVWKYASVKDVGDLDLLKTVDKVDVVTAINNLIEGKIAVPVSQDFLDRMIAVEGQSGKIIDIETLQEEERLLRIEMARKAAEMRVEVDAAKAGIIAKADLTYVDGELVKKIDTSKYQSEYDAVKTDLLEKVNIEEYETERELLVADINKKASAIDVNSKVASLNESIALQQTSIDEAKTGITGLSTKTDELSTKVTTDVTNLQAKIAENASSIASQGGTLTTISSDLDEVKGEYTVQAQTLTDIDGRIGSAETEIGLAQGAISLKANSADVYTKAQTNTELGKKVALTEYNSKMSELNVTTEGINQTVSAIKGTIGTGAVGEVGTLKSEIARVDVKADGIVQSVSSIESSVSGQETRIAEAESTITQQTNAINLKAEASSVYTKTQSDTALGKKVDNSVYASKMSAIDVSISGINQTVSSQKTSIDNTTGIVTGHTQQISTIDQKADGIALRVAETEGDISGLAGRVGTAETSISANTNAINLRAEKTVVEAIGGRVSSAEAELEVQSGQISQRVTKIDFDDAVGVNKWVSTKYPIVGTDLTQTPPSFPLIKGRQSTEMKEVADATALAISTGTSQITHLFTNVYMTVAKTVSLSVKYNSSVGIYLNGAMIYQNKSNAQALVTVSLSFRAGWNTVEILHGLQSGTPVLNLGKTLSTQVDKLTSVIGVGNKNETRLTQAETSIIQSDAAIALKAEKTEVAGIGNRLSTAEGSITILNDSITSKVEKTEFNAYSQRVSNAESKITQTESAILQKVEKTDYNILNDKVTSQATSISQLNDEIGLKVNQEDYDGLNGRVATAESQVNLNKNAIALKANQTELNTVSGRLTTAEGSLTVANNQIATKVSQTEFDDDMAAIEGRMKSAETSITQTAGAIVLKADAATTYNKTEVDGKISTVVSDTNTKFTQTNNNINLKANSTDVYTKVQTNTELAKKTDNTVFNALVTRVSTAESEIDQTSQAIALRVTKTEMDTGVATAVSTAKSEIKITTDGISQTVGTLSSKVNAQGETLTSHTTSINQLNGSIVLKADSATVTTELGKKADQSALNTLSNTVSDIFSDLKVTPVEKSVLKREWEAIKAQNAQLTTQATALGVSTTTYASAFNALNGTVPRIELDILAAMGTTYTFSSATVRNTFQAQWNTYFTQAETLRKALTDKIQANAAAANTAASNAQGTANTANGTANTLRDTTVPAIVTRLSSAEQKITADAITSTVRSSTTYKADMDAKATPADIDSKISTLEIGGRNYYKTNTPITNLSNAPILARNPSTASNGFRLTGQLGLTGSVRLGSVITDNGWWTVSFWGMANGASTIAMDVADGAVQSIPFLTTWKKFELSFEVKNYSTVYNFVDIANIGHIHYDLKDLKIEKGNKATDWTPAPEDVDATIESAQTTANSGVTKANSAQTTANTAVTNASNAQGTANTALSNANTAIANAKIANDAITDILSDMKVTPLEKNSLKTTWEKMKAEYAQVILNASALGVSSSALTTAYNAIVTTAPRIELDVLATMNTTYTFGTTTLRDTFRNQINGYFTQSELLQNAIRDKIQANAAAAQTTANSGVSKADTAQTTANTALTNAGTANSLIADMSSDMKITPLEKNSLKTTWESMKAEYAQVILNASALSVSATALTTAYNAIVTTTPRIELDVLATMNTTYTFGTTALRDAFRNQINGYFTQSQLLQNAIRDKIQANAAAAQTTANSGVSKADTAQGTANTANTTANTARTTANTALTDAGSAIEIAKAMASGSIIYEDPTFKSGVNGVSVYNNSANSNVIVSRIAKPADAPTKSTHALEIKTIGVASPSFGGFYQGINSRASAKFVVRYIMKVPVGYSLNVASNAMGTSYTDRIITPTAGTGKYEEYIRVIQCGVTGTFSQGGHIHISGTVTPTTTAPLLVYLASIEAYDVSDYQPVPESIQRNLDNASSSIADMISDMKVTPLEKNNLKTTWDSIKAEYTQLLANANALSVATTTYTTAYNAMVTTAPRIELDVLANMATTYTFGTTALRDAFRAQFNTYFLQREALQKAVRDKIQANAAAAQTTANTANGTANTANGTANTLKNTTVPALTTRVSTAESSITQQAEQIALRVETKDYNGNTVASLINQSATTIKIIASKINLVGAVTVLSSITGNLGTITAGKITGAEFLSTSTTSDILIKDGYILNAEDTSNPTASPRTYIQSGYILIRSEGSREYTWYDSSRIYHENLDLSNNYRITSLGDIQLEPRNSMNNEGKVIINGGLEIPAGRFQHPDGGIKMNNTDLVGVNQIFMNDPATTDSEGMNWAKSTTVEGSVKAADYDTFRIYNGTGYLNSVPIFTDDVTEILWSGALYMTNSHTITPTKKITDCPNGWVFVWSRYANGVGENSHFNLVHVHKRFATLTSAGMWHQLKSSGTVENPIDANKYMYINTATAVGHASNNSSNGNNTQVLRYVLAY